jgi:localization factor PodJL
MGNPVGENMNKAVPWSVRGVGFDVREAAQEAAHREGMTLSQWLSEAIANRATQAGINLEDLNADDHLDAVAERLRELDTRRRETNPERSARTRLRSDVLGNREPPRMAMRPREPVSGRSEAPAPFNAEALLEKAVELFEKRSAKSQQQTADALASVARIMEANENGATNLKVAFARLESRLDAMARRPAPETRQSLPPRNDSEPLNRLEAKLNSILAAITPANSDAPQQSRADLRGTSSRRSLGEAIAQIARRQYDLEDPATQQAAPAPANPLDRPASQSDIAALASRLDDMQRAVLERAAAPAPVFDLDRLHAEIAHMTTALPDLATQSSVAALDSSIRVLAREIEVSRSEGANETVLRPLERSVAELRRSLAEIDPRTTITGLESEIRALGSKLEGLGRHDVETGAFLQVQQQTQEIRDLLTAAAARPAAVEKIEQQVAQLARSLDRQQQIAAMPNEGRTLGSVTDEIRTLLKEPPQSAALAKIEERLDAIAGRVEDALGEVRNGRNHTSIEHHIDRVRQDLSARIAASTNGPPDTRALEDLVRGLADKMERAHQPDSNAQAFEALEQQISQLAARLDRSSTGLNSLTYLEQSIGDLFAKLDATQQATVEAAETAARNATRDSLHEILAQGAFEPRHAVANTGFDHEEVTRELSELRGLQDAADRRTHSTLNAVHETLEKVVDRLAMLEDELGEVRPDVSHSTLASGPAPHFARPPSSEDPPGSSPGTRPTEPYFDEHDVKPSRGDLDDFLIEPGRGFPGRGEKQVDTPDNKRKAAVDRRPGVADSAVTGRADFIAAARRAAQAAQMESAAAAMQARPAPVAAGEGPTRASLVEQARTFIAQHKRPVVLSVAALFLAVGAYAVVKSLGHAPGDLSYEAPKEQTQNYANAAPAPAIATSKIPSITPAPAPSLGNLLAQAENPQAGAATKEPPKSSAIAGSDPIVVNSITPRPKDAAVPAETTHDMMQVMLQSQADLGNAKAQFEIASRYAEGRGFARDLKVAAQWYDRAAAQGLASAQYRLGAQYEKGLGVTRDAAQAKAWYQKAAEQGNIRAMHNLAVVLAEIGDSGKPDYAAAAQWFRKAAEYGVRDSQYNYAILLARGLGVAQNLASSYSWFAIAAAQGDEDAGKKRDDVAARLTADNLAAAKAMVEAFRPKSADPAANDVQWPSSAAIQPFPTKAQRPKVSQL